MRPGSPRWHEVSDSEFPHEREGLAHVRELLPDRAPYRAWSNFEFRDSQGKWHEVDLLVLGEGRLHLVELKHYRGPITGTAYRWRRNRRSLDSPLLLARRKAQRLASLIKDGAGRQGLFEVARVPYVQECVFLHARDGRCELPRAEATDLFGLDGLENVSGLPSIADRLLEPRTSRDRLIASDEELAELFTRIGFAVRRQREVGSWRLVGPPLAEGEDWQDWPAEHRLAHGDRARIRFFVSPPGASETARAGTRKLVEREYALTNRLHHEGVLRPRDLVEDDLGVGLVYPHDESARRLDLWLADRPGGLALATQVDLIRQLAEALAYVHRHHVVHRGLSPTAVFITEDDGSGPTARLSDWKVAGLDAPTSGSDQGRHTATRIFHLLEGGETASPERRQAEAYLAPEGRWALNVDRVRLDVFALGALVYHVVAGRPPAGDAGELRDRLRRDRGLDLVADVPEVPGALRKVVLESTRPTVSERKDLTAFLAGLDDVDREVGAPGAGHAGDPLEAAPGTLIGSRFELLRRLGSGSTAVGLLVTDRESGGEKRVLKVALNDAASRRLLDEAEVLRTLRRQPHPRLIRLVEEHPLRVGSRTALLLESAGGETLADVLRERPRLSLDLLERWGTDVLEALVGLDKAGVDHRDVKPANLGVREQRSDRAKHLVLFDFSLAKASAGSVEAGTRQYLDPFLGGGARPYWDSAAERYAAAVTLFEMATGRVPVFGDGVSNPAVIRDEATIEPGAFDPSIAGSLLAFFRRALRRDARERFDTAADMLAAWRSVFTSTTTTVPDDAEERAAAAGPETSLAEAGLSARALSALEPFHLSTVGDLAAVDPGRLSPLKGIANPTRREVRSRAKQWRERFGAAVAERRFVDEPAPPGRPDDPLADPEGTAEALVRSAGSARATARRRAARVLVGLDEGAGAFATLADLAEPLGLGGPPQVSRVLADIRDAWADDVAARERLDKLMAHTTEALAGLGGAGWADDVVAALAAGQSSPQRFRVVAGLVRAALDRADDKARGGDDPSPVVRRRRRSDGRVLLASPPELAEAAAGLAASAD
ncbi:MAG: BREX system serine/threonine kinase PglW, partial [Streptomycetales bacterium]